MRILCLCPTYNHASLLPNTIACFLAQDHPDKRLLILDDAGQIQPQRGDNWEIFSTPNRFPSLPAKYNALLAHAAHDSGWRPDAYAVWDDDDVYLPWHLSAAAAALSATGGYWSRPAVIWSMYAKREEHPSLESSAGRFHGAAVFTAEFIAKLGGWIQTGRADFDQLMLGTARAYSPPADPCDCSPEQRSSYVYRWGSTDAGHCSGLMRTPADETWYARYAVHQPLPPVGPITPAYDAETRYLLDLLTPRSTP